jgi:hypothetical protein
MTKMDLFGVIALAHGAGTWSLKAVIAARDGEFGLCAASVLLTVCLVFIAYMYGAPHVRSDTPE